MSTSVIVIGTSSDGLVLISGILSPKPLFSHPVRFIVWAGWAHVSMSVWVMSFRTADRASRQAETAAAGVLWLWLNTEAKTSFLVLMATLWCVQMSREKTKSEIMRLKDVLDILRKWLQKYHTYCSDWGWSIKEKIHQGSVESFWHFVVVRHMCFYRTFWITNISNQSFHACLFR